VCLGKEGDIYKQIICIEVDEFNNIPDDMVSIEIPEQEYIYCKHIGPVNMIGDSFTKMYKWAKENNFETDQFKIDCEYANKGLEEHDLYIRIISNTSKE
jgi:predicted transcriptional regulator YdeE